MNQARQKKFSYLGKGLVFTDKNAITCHVCGSPQHKVRGCPENRKIQQFNRRNEAYKPIYNRYHVMAPKALKLFNPIFENVNNAAPLRNWDEEWDTEDTSYSYKDALEANKLTGPINDKNKDRSTLIKQKNSVTTSKGSKGKDIEKLTFRSWNEANIQAEGSNKKKSEEERIKTLERQMIQFTEMVNNLINMVKSLQGRVTDLEVRISNRGETPHNKKGLDVRFTDNVEDVTFKNDNLKRQRIHQGMRKQPLDTHVIAPEIMTRQPAPIESESNVILPDEIDTEYTNTVSTETGNNSNISPNSSRIDGLEQKMSDAFASLGNLTDMIKNVFPNQQ